MDDNETPNPEVFFRRLAECTWRADVILISDYPNLDEDQSIKCLTCAAETLRLMQTVYARRGGPSNPKLAADLHTGIDLLARVSTRQPIDHEEWVDLRRILVSLNSMAVKTLRHGAKIARLMLSMN